MNEAKVIKELEAIQQQHRNFQSCIDTSKGLWSPINTEFISGLQRVEDNTTYTEWKKQQENSRINPVRKVTKANIIKISNLLRDIQALDEAIKRGVSEQFDTEIMATHQTLENLRSGRLSLDEAKAYQATPIHYLPETVNQDKLAKFKVERKALSSEIKLQERLIELETLLVAHKTLSTSLETLDYKMTDIPPKLEEVDWDTVPINRDNQLRIKIEALDASINETIDDLERKKGQWERLEETKAEKKAERLQSLQANRDACQTFLSELKDMNPVDINSWSISNIKSKLFIKVKETYKDQDLQAVGDEIRELRQGINEKISELESEQKRILDSQPSIDALLAHKQALESYASLLEGVFQKGLEIKLPLKPVIDLTGLQGQEQLALKLEIDRLETFIEGRVGILKEKKILIDFQDDNNTTLVTRNWEEIERLEKLGNDHMASLLFLQRLSTPPQTKEDIAQRIELSKAREATVLRSDETIKAEIQTLEEELGKANVPELQAKIDFLQKESKLNNSINYVEGLIEKKIVAFESDLLKKKREQPLEEASKQLTDKIDKLSAFWQNSGNATAANELTNLKYALQEHKNAYFTALENNDAVSDDTKELEIFKNATQRAVLACISKIDNDAHTNLPEQQAAEVQEQTSVFLKWFSELWAKLFSSKQEDLEVELTERVVPTSEQFKKKFDESIGKERARQSVADDDKENQADNRQDGEESNPDIVL